MSAPTLRSPVHRRNLIAHLAVIEILQDIFAIASVPSTASRSSVLILPVILCVLFTAGDLVSVIHLHATWFGVVYIGILLVLDIAVFGLAFHCATFISRTGCSVRHALQSSVRHIMTQPARTLLMVSGVFMVILISVRVPVFGFLFCGALIAWISDHGTVNTSGE